MVNTLRELFLEIMNNYRNTVSQPFADNALANLIRNKPKELIEPILTNKSLFVDSSPGKGNWAEVPWIAIINKNETDGAQEGVYIVYLFSEDMKRVYLTFNQGVSRPIKNDGRKLAFQKLTAKAIDIRTNYPLSNFIPDNNLILAKKGLGADYEKATIYYKEYSVDNLPEDQILIEDLKKIVAFYDNYLLESNVLTEGTDFTAYIGQVEEGKRLLKKHYIRERNPKVIKEAKRLALESRGELRCEVCGFLFSEHYGERGKDFIEGHHKIPVSQMQEGQRTSPEDIALLCSNCHKMIHIKMPPISVEELKKIYN